ncbi:MAG: glucosyltransferase domain-containing protein [Cyclobacteriaceae bacterium]|nr:glucosyltransferase domain-containing protein [Cyclobacteriaceae bacterium]
MANIELSKSSAHLILIGFVVLLFHPVLQTYAYTDVYEFLYNSHNDNFINVFIQGGRPIYGLLNKFFFTKVSAVSQLFWLRLFGVFGILSTALLLFYILNQLLLNRLQALLCSLFFLCSPSASVIGIWAGTYQVGWALSSSLLGGYLLVIALSQTPDKSKWGLVALSFILTIASLLAYQPAATAFVVPGFILLMKTMDLKRLSYFLATYFTSFVVYFGIHKLILVFTNLSALSRTNLALNPIVRLEWFFTEPMADVLSDNFIFYSYGWRIVARVVFLIFALLSFYFLPKGMPLKKVIMFVGLVIVFFISAYMPNLISSDTWVSYRTLSTLFILKWTLVLTAVNKWEQWWKPSVIIPYVVGLFLLANAVYNINSGFVSIQSEEYQKVSAEVNRLIPSLRNEKKMIFVMPEIDMLEKLGTVRRVVTDEFGSLSSSRDWVPIPMVKQILVEANERQLADELEIKILSQTGYNEAHLPNYLPVLNIEDFYIQK